MANPQKENGYTAIANEILDALIGGPAIPSEVRRIVDFIIRKTYGFNKRDDYISLSQFALSSRIKKANCVRAINKALSMNLIIRSDNDRGYKYRFNKDFTKWKSLSPRMNVIPTDNNSLSPRSTTKDIYTKYITDSNKNMRKTDERKFDADYIPSVDEEGNLIISKPETKGGKEMKRLLLWAIKRRKSYFVNTAKQYKAMKMMRIAGIDPGKIEDRWIEMENDRFYRANGFDFMDVANSFDKKP